MGSLKSESECTKYYAITHHISMKEMNECCCSNRTCNDVVANDSVINCESKEYEHVLTMDKMWLLNTVVSSG